MKKIVLFLLLILFPVNVFASVEAEINPEWIEYMRLSEEEKSTYEIIPSKYIYEYIPKEQNNILDDYMEYPTLGEDDSYFNLTNVDGKNCSNTKNKNQSSLGLCSAFASVGIIESHMLKKGVKGIEEEIAKCDEVNDPNSIYCQYKTDMEINEKYKNGEVSDNATFSERLIDYMDSNPKYSVGNGQTFIKEGYNPYAGTGNPGSGGGIGTQNNVLYDVGLAPRRTLNIWQDYFVQHKQKTLEEVFDSVPNMYQLTDYYEYPRKPQNATQLKSWIKGLKSLVSEYGAVDISTRSPDDRAGACYYEDTINNKHLINESVDSNCATSHAMQIIGWDDNYSYSYCKIEGYETKDSNGNDYTSASCRAKGYYWNYLKGCKVKDESLNEIYTKTNYTKTKCESEGKTWHSTKGCKINVYTEDTCKPVDANDTATYTWVSGKGAWILKNSWGSTTPYLYPYLAYESDVSGINGVREISVTNYDNAYNKKTNTVKEVSKYFTIENNIQVYTNIFKINKSLDLEYLTRLNIKFKGYGQDYKVYISDNDNDYIEIAEGYVDYSGLRTKDLNKKLDKPFYYIKIVGNDVDSINFFTKNKCIDNCESPSISSYMDANSFAYGTNNFNIYTKTDNIKSGVELDFKLYDENRNLISENISFEKNYIVNNFNNATLNTEEPLKNGKYTLEVKNENLINKIDFSIVDPVYIKLIVPEPLMLDDKTAKINYNLSYDMEVSNFHWKSSNEKVVTIDNEGNIQIIGNGTSTITLTVDTPVGTISTTEDVIIYEEIIKTVDDFINMLTESKRGKTYYLNNDLNFSGYTLNNSSTFSGIFNGGKHILKNITINNVDNETDKDASLFNVLSNATIKNVIIKDSSFKGDDSAAIANASTNSKLTGIYVDAEIIGTSSASGFIEDSYNTIYNECVNAGKVEAISNTTHTYAAGIVSYSMYDTIKNSYNSGEIYSKTNFTKTDYNTVAHAAGLISDSYESEITNSYNVGNVKAESDISNAVIYTNGLYNSSDYAISIDSYYLNDDSYTNQIEGASKTREELLNPDTFSSWDLSNIWYLDGENYPVLRRFMTETKVSEITLDKTEVTLEIGKTEIITATVKPDNATNKNLIWISNNEQVAEVENGVITAVNTGTTEIKVKSADGSEIEEIITVTVTEPVIKVSEITLDKTEVTLEIGKTEIITATIKPDNATNKNIIWSSNNENVATVDHNGKVTAVSRGTATITATSEDGGKTDTCEVTVHDPKITLGSIIIESDYNNILYSGYHGAIIIPITRQDIASTVPIKLNFYKKNVEVYEKLTDSMLINKIFSSSTVSNNTTTLTLDILHEIDSGEYKVEMYYDNSNHIEFNFNVIEPILVEEIISKDIALKIDEEKTIEYSIKNNNALNQNVTFEITEPSIAKVENGKIKGLKPGNTILKIIPQDGSPTKEINISVVNLILKDLTTIPETIYDYTGGDVSLNAKLENIEIDKVKVDLYKEETKVQESKEFTVEENEANIEFDIPKGTSAGTYIIKVTAGRYTETQTFKIEEYKTVGEFKFLFNNSTIDKIILIKNDTLNIVTNFTNKESTFKDIAYSTKDSNIISVDNNGNVTGLNVGKTELIATVGYETFKLPIEIIEEPQITYNTERYSNVKGNDEIDNHFGGKIEINRTTINKLSNMTFDIMENIPESCINYNYDTENKIIINIKENCNITPGDYKYVEKLHLNDTKNTVKEFNIDYKIVEYIPLEAIESNIEKIILKTNEKFNLKENIIIESSSATNKNIGYVNYNKEIINISEDGIITALKSGTTQVTVQSEYNKTISKTINVMINPTIKNIQNENIKIESKTNNILYAGYGGKITAYITTENIIDGESLLLKYYKDSVEQEEMSNTFSTNGNIIENNKLSLKFLVPKDLPVGKYKIELSYEKAEPQEFEFEVFEPSLVGKITASDIALTVEEEQEIKYTIENNNALNKNITFEITDPSIAKVENDKIKGLKPGNTTLKIIPQDGSVITIVNVIVKDKSFIQNNYLIDYEKGTIRRIDSGTNYEDFFNKFKWGYNVKFEAYNDKILLNATDKIKTMNQLKITNYDTIENYTLIVDGDINGDGEILANDILSAKLHILEKSKLSGIEFDAGDIDLDSKILANDILYMKIYILEKSDKVWGN